MVAITAEYRVKSRNKTSPFECVADGKSAVRFIRANAAKLGVDPKRVAAGGGSAGGHVAAATGNCPELEESEDTKISINPMRWCYLIPSMIMAPGLWPQSRAAAVEDVSPMHNIRKGAPPTIVFLGTRMI